MSPSNLKKIEFLVLDLKDKKWNFLNVIDVKMLILKVNFFILTF